jgi:GntR family transcriptional regulator
MPVIRHNTAYSAVADTLRRKILRGTLPPGAQLPTEFDLCAACGASRITIRRALAILEDERLIHRRPRYGTFVNPAQERKIPLLNTDFTGSVTHNAPRLRRRLTDWGWRPAPGPVAAILHVPAQTPVLYAQRVDALAGRPAAYDDLYLPAACARRVTKADLDRLNFIEYWQHAEGLRLQRIQQSVDAVASQSAQASLLGIRPGVPLLREVSTYFQAAGGPAGVFMTYYRHDLFRIVSIAPLVPSRAPQGRSTR